MNIYPPARTTIMAALVAVVVVILGLDSTAMAAKKPPVIFSPTKLMTTNQDSAQAWVRNSTGAKLRVTRSVNDEAAKSVSVAKGLQRVNLPSIGLGESAKMALSARYRGRTFTFSSYLTRPGSLIIHKEVEAASKKPKPTLIVLESDRKITELTNATVVAKDGRTVRCPASEFDTRFEYSPMCEVTLPGDFIPRQVLMAVFTKSKPGENDNGTSKMKITLAADPS